MAEEVKQNQEEILEEVEETAAEAVEGTVEEAAPQTDPLEEAKKALAQEHDNYLRLAAEYDNFRKRSQKEKDVLYRDGKADAIGKFLPVYDNLARALEQETADAAYKKGVEMTMTGFEEVLKKMDVKIFGEAGEIFDPNLHNAVMHVEGDEYKEGEIVQVFQKGFAIGDKVIRFAMVQTAN